MIDQDTVALHARAIAADMSRLGLPWLLQCEDPTQPLVDGQGGLLGMRRIAYQCYQGLREDARTAFILLSQIDGGGAINHERTIALAARLGLLEASQVDRYRLALMQSRADLAREMRELFGTG